MINKKSDIRFYILHHLNKLYSNTVIGMYAKDKERLINDIQKVMNKIYVYSAEKKMHEITNEDYYA